LNGFALADHSGRLGQPGERQELLALLEQHPPGQYLTMRRIFSSLRRGEILTDVGTGLDIILAGIEAAARRSHRP
jgi:hypothetical protein